MTIPKVALEEKEARACGGIAVTTLLLSSVLLWAGCVSSGVTSDRAPQLTNPPRHDAWAGGVAAGPIGKYEGIFRLPLSDDWTYQLPDTGHWVLS